jgi:hypothetical protein
VNGRVVIKTHGVNVGKKRQERRSIVVASTFRASRAVSLLKSMVY